jgi:hypothetical protein
MASLGWEGLSKRNQIKIMIRSNCRLVKSDEKSTDSIETVKFIEQLAFQGTYIKLFLRLFNSLLNLLKKKSRPLYLKPHFVPRSKHTPSRL